MVLSENLERSRPVCRRTSDSFPSDHSEYLWLRIHFTPVSTSHLDLEDEAEEHANQICLNGSE